MAFRLDLFVLALVLFSLFIVGGTFLISDINNNYGTSISTDEFNDTYNTIDEMYGLSQDMKNKTIAAEIESGDESWESMTKGSYNAVRLVRNTFKLVGDIINDIADTLKVPSFFIVFAMASLTFMIIFGIIYLFMRFRP